MYLVVVHHVSEAGQGMNPHIDVLMLDGPHGELQRRGQVTAAGRQLGGDKRTSLIPKQQTPVTVLITCSHHVYDRHTDLFVVLQNDVDVFQLWVVGQEVNLMEVVIDFFPVGD